MENQIFEFTSYTYRPQEHKAYFKYTIHGSEERVFTETLTLPSDPRDVPAPLLDEVLFSLHVALGISYWKTTCPKTIEVKSGTLTQKQAEYWNTVYTKGLGEFFYKNKIDFRNLIQFPYKDISKKSTQFSFSDRSLLGLGGGKDSLVSLELLKKAGKDITGMIIETQKEYALLKELISIADIPILQLKRELDPQLFQKEMHTYDGHIPISAVYAWIGVLLGIVNNYRYLIVSNERSANYGNTEYLGAMINHQWSKSEEFEQMTQSYIKDYITPEFSYFSLLRPFSEMKIVELFTQFPQYFPHFSSCNRNFAISEEKQIQTKWCGECPKCAFVFVLLAAYLPKEQMIRMFGKNLLESVTLENLYRELLGISGIKPFECVGTPEETQYAFSLISEKGSYTDDLIMKMFEKECAETFAVDTVKQLAMEVHQSSTIPESFQSIIFS